MESRGAMQHTLSGEEMARLWAAGAIEVVDVRQPIEYRFGHIPGARLIPLTALRARWQEIPRDRPVVVYCLTQHRSPLALRLLCARGLTGVRQLAGGLLAWRGPVKKGPPAGVAH